MIKISAPCGAGKSYSIEKNAYEWVMNDGMQVIVAVPSRDLADQYHHNLTTLHPDLPVEIIHGEMDSVEYPVCEILALLMQKAEPMVLIITQRAWEILCELDFYSHYNRILVLDEIPMPFKMERYFDVKGIAELLPLIEARESNDHIYYTIMVKPECRRQLKKIAAWRTEDKKLTRLQEIAYQLLSNNWTNFVNKKAWDTRHTIEFDLMCLITRNIYEGFKQVYIAGACFDDSALFKWYEKQGIIFDVDEKIMEGLRYREHFNGKQLTIYYSIPRGYNWTKDFMQGQGINKAVDEDGNFKHEAHNLKLVEKSALELFDRPFLFNDNIAKEKNNFYQVFAGVERAIHLPQSIHGLNSFMEYNDVVCLSARNLPVDYINFLKKFIGLSINEIRNCIGRQFCYQSALRGSLRDPYNNQEPKRVYIPDQETAEWFQSMFPGSVLIYRPIEGLEMPKGRGKPRKYKDEIERNIARQVKLEKQLIGSLDTTYTDEATADRNLFRCSLFKHTEDKEGLGRMSLATHVKFEAQLLNWHNVIDRPKKDNILMSPTYFTEVEYVSSGRAAINALYCNGIMLDVDGIKVRDANGKIIDMKAPIKPEAFAALFPRLRMTIYNSSSSTDNHPRYRVYIPTNRWMTEEEYNRLVDNLVYIAGGNNIGIDMTKIFAHSLFYIPCQAKNPFDNFFQTFDEEDRRVMDVDIWLPMKWEVEAPKVIGQVDYFRDDAKIAKAIEMYSPAIALEGQGNAYNFLMAGRLKAAGVDVVEYAQIAEGEVVKCSTKKKQAARRKEIKAIVKDWGKLNSK